MRKILWSDRLNTGVKKIDDQHKRLVKLVNNLVSAIQQDFADEIKADICRELAEYVEYHFRDEEMLMEEVGYPGLEQQKQQHADLTATVQKHLASFESDTPIEPTELLHFLSNWLINHILHCDMKIRHHLEQMPRG